MLLSISKSSLSDLMKLARKKGDITKNVLIVITENNIAKS
jgi:hypothetical protein